MVPGARSPHSHRARRLAQLRRPLWCALLCTPLGLVWGVDLSARAARLADFGWSERALYLLASGASFALWGSLLVLAAQQRGWLRHAVAAAVSVLAALALGGQQYVYDQYATYVNADAAHFGVALGSSVLGYLRADLANFGRYVAVPAGVVVLLALAARRVVRPRRSHRRWATGFSLLACALILLPPCWHRRVQAATPDVLLVHAVGRVLATRVGLVSDGWKHVPARTPDYVPSLVSAPPRPRNVLFVLNESQRADVVCVAHDPQCAQTPFSNAVAPERTPLMQHRAVATVTAISVAVLWSGMSPMQPLEALQSSPLLWDFARAANWSTLYVTSQPLEFANARDFVKDLPLDRACEAIDLVPQPDLNLGAPDELATARALRDLSELREPFFAVVHYSNTHFPYRVDPALAPFQPSTESKDPDRNHEFFRHYQNANYLQDKTVADLIRGVRALPVGPRTVIVYTADHGEAFREHHQMGHGAAIYDEELRVPAWVDAPAGTLTDAEQGQLQAASRTFTFHTDVAPTILDLMGVWDAPELGRYRAKMHGKSLLRDAARADAVPVTNCAAVWGCPLRNWGMMRERWKLEAREWDPDWHCFDVLADPGERNDLGPRACADLVSRANEVFGGHPNGRSVRP